MRSEINKIAELVDEILKNNRKIKMMINDNATMNEEIQQIITDIKINQNI